jgi:hypothetical protein
MTIAIRIRINEIDADAHILTLWQRSIVSS